MALKPKKHLTEQEIRGGLSMVIWDGLAAEVMIAFTGSTFLTAMAILLGANNIQIGLLASMPTYFIVGDIIRWYDEFKAMRFKNKRKKHHPYSDHPIP